MKQAMKNWIAIVNMRQSSGPRAIALLDDELDNVAMFISPDEISTLQKTHVLKHFEWWAFNVTTGEVEEL